MPLSLPYERLAPYRLFFAHVRKRWWIYFIGMCAVIVTNVTEVLVPKCVQWSIDLARGGRIPEALQRATAQQCFEAIFSLLVITLILQAVSRRYWRMTLGMETTYVGASLRSAVWERARFFSERRLQKIFTVGNVMSIATSDVTTGRTAFGWVLVGIIDLLFLSLFTIVAMAAIDWQLTIFAICLFPVLAVLLRKLHGREYAAHERAQKALSLLNEMCSQAIASIKLQKLSVTGPFWVSRLTAAAGEYRERRFVVVATALQFLLLMGLLPLFAYVVIFFFGMQRVMSGTISIGEFVAFQSYVFILQGPLAEMGYVLADWQRAIASLARVIDLLKEPAAPGLLPQPAQLPISELDRSHDAPFIECRQLSFKYDSDERQILSNVSLSLAPREKLGICGPIGSGKSTFLKIIAGLESGYEGKVLLWGRDIRNYRHDALRREISMLPQRPFLFADTVRNNVTLGAPLNDDQVWYYLEVAALADEINRLPQRLDAPLGEWGINLSGGQKQRLTLARALAARPNLLLFDDCLSAVDAVTEEKILSALEREIGSLTMIWVAHRRSTLRLCQRVVEFGL